jgi:hypothetical protein
MKLPKSVMKWAAQSGTTNQGRAFTVDAATCEQMARLVASFMILMYWRETSSFALKLYRSRDSSVGTATGYGPDGRVPDRVKIFIFSTSSRPVLGPTQPPIRWVPGASSPPRVKRPGHETDHSSPTSVEVKNRWIYTFSPPYAFMT